MYICLVCLAYKMCKFHIAKDILSKDDILKVLSIQVDGLESLTKSCQDQRLTKVTPEMKEIYESMNKQYHEFHF